MKINRWQKSPKNMMSTITDKELNICLMELETKGLSDEVYRYYMKTGIAVVYYMFDEQYLNEGFFKPVYLLKSDIYFLDIPEETLFQRVLENTVSIFQTRLIPFHIFLHEMEIECEQSLVPIIRELVEVMKEIKRDNWLWCLTSSLKDRGASGTFFKPLLRAFCETTKNDKLLIGIGNNDYALIAKVNANTIPAIRELTYNSNNVRADSSKIIGKRILVYDYEMNELQIFSDEEPKR